MIKNEIRARVLRRALKDPLTLRLFSDVDDNTGIVELVGGGYQPAGLVLADWNLDEGIGTGPVREFRFNGSKRARVMGACLTEGDGGIVWLKKFDAPIDVGRNGDIIPVRPVVRIETLL